MMAEDFARILQRYGQSVTVYNRQAPEGMTLRAFLQPVRERGMLQALPTDLGETRQDRLLYLGPPEAALETDGVCGVEVGGELYRPQSAQAVRVGEEVSHWWAVLAHRAQEAV